MTDWRIIDINLWQKGRHTHCIKELSKCLWFPFKCHSSNLLCKDAGLPGYTSHHFYSVLGGTWRDLAWYCCRIVLTSHSLLCEGSGLLTWECLVNCLRHWVPHPEPHPECDNKARVSSSDKSSFSTRTWIMRETHYDKLWSQFGTFGHYWAVFLIIPSPL